MKFKTLLIILLLTTAFACKNNKGKTLEEQENVEEVQDPNLIIHPISHATMVLEWYDTVMYVDPVGGKEAFEGKKSPNLILVTDIHSDHLDVETLETIAKETTKIIAPSAVIEKLTEPLKSIAVQLSNNESKIFEGFQITGIPMYNLREEALHFHEKGRGNGYLLENNNYRVYISGDTEDIPEMRSLKNIDIAFVCMNLPYTMTVESAASAVSEFKPKTVIPYHYRGIDGFSDVDTFEKLVNENAPEVEVKRIDFYPMD